jgi:hypothetical protein
MRCVCHNIAVSCHASIPACVVISTSQLLPPASLDMSSEVCRGLPQVSTPALAFAFAFAFAFLCPANCWGRHPAVLTWFANRTKCAMPSHLIVVVGNATLCMQ